VAEQEFTTEKFQKYFDHSSLISDKAWDIFVSKLIRREYPKNATILKNGQVENFISFVDTGIIRFFIPNEEQEMTFAFVFENELMSAYDSFLMQTASTYAVQTITPTVLWSFTHKSLQDLYQEVPISNVIGRMACEELYIKKTARELSLLNQNAQERYLNIFAERPMLLQQIPLKYIASYIGITPQALSRIRRRIS